MLFSAHEDRKGSQAFSYYPLKAPWSGSKEVGRMSNLVTYADGAAVSGRDRADERRVEPGVADTAARRPREHRTW